MSEKNWDELLVKCAEKPTAAELNRLLQMLAADTTPARADSLKLLWEAWGEAPPNVAAREFLLEVAELSLPENAVFRQLLSTAIKESLPPYLNRIAYLRALGLNDEKRPTRDLPGRFRKILEIKNGVMIFLVGSSRWGTAGILDSINGSVSMAPFAATGGIVAMPLDTLLSDAVLLRPGTEMLKIVTPNRNLSAADFRALVRRQALTPVSDEAMRKMAQAGCARGLTPEALEAWYTREASAAAPGGASRRAADSRSLKELSTLLAKEAAAAPPPFSPEEVTALENFFTVLKKDTAAREATLLAEVVTQLKPRAAREDLRRMLVVLKEKAPFWPERPASAPISALAVWGELPVKSLEPLAAATAEVFPEEYLVGCALRLPLKALNAIMGELEDDAIVDYFYDLGMCSADLIAWVWKNRKKHKELLILVSLDNVLRALSQESLPKAWGAAQRELRELFLDNADFQKQMIASTDDNASRIASSLQSALFLLPGERQSLMVKLSRHSEALRGLLETGVAQRILTAGMAKSEQEAAATNTTANEPNYTSHQSHKRLIEELDHLVNVLVPENRESLKTARAHGDFRENSEFDAAKERRNFLSRRRGELERELANVQPIAFAGVLVEDHAVIGCRLELEDVATGEREIYYLLGAWDGNPEKRYLSYKTRLGQSLYGCKKGDKIEIPGERTVTLASLAPLPAEVLQDLD